MKFGREEKLFTPPSRRRKTKLNQAQLQQIEGWIEENPNITIKEMRIRIQEKFGLMPILIIVESSRKQSKVV